MIMMRERERDALDGPNHLRASVVYTFHFIVSLPNTYTAVISKPIIIFTLGVFLLFYSDFSFRRFISFFLLQWKDTNTYTLHQDHSLYEKNKIKFKCSNDRLKRPMEEKNNEFDLSESNEDHNKKDASRIFLSMLIILFASAGLSF